MVDVQRALPEYREASRRKSDTSFLARHTDKYVANHSVVQKRLSIYNWNPGLRRVKEDVFVKQIACKWHIITTQEASECVDNDILTKRFHVTHDGGCAVLFSEDTFCPDIQVKSIYFHDTRRGIPDQVVEGGQEWVMQGVPSRASFRRTPLSCLKIFYCVMCAYLQCLR